MPPTITSPLRLLLLSTPETPHPSIFKGDSSQSPLSAPLLQDPNFTNAPSLPDTTHHPLHTPYYTASIPIWRDILPTTAPTLSAWKDEWTAPEAGEVVQALGAWVVCFKKPRVKDDLVRALHDTTLEGKGLIKFGGFRTL